MYIPKWLCLDKIVHVFWLFSVQYDVYVCVALESIITNTCPCHIQIFFKNVFILFLLLLKTIDCGYTLEPPHRGGSNAYLQSMFWSNNKKNRYTPAYPSFTI